MLHFGKSFTLTLKSMETQDSHEQHIMCVFEGKGCNIWNI